MSYIINKTDGSVLTEVVDGTIDQITTDVTLVGKNATTYGELFNENFVKILENFANTSQPNNPLAGQLWYDTTEARLKVYDGSQFKVSGGTIVGGTFPSSIAAGDIFIDNYRQQMFFNDGNSNLLAGPAYTAQQGISGIQVTDIVDTNNINHTVVYFYVGQVLLGIFSNATFTPLEAIPGFSPTEIKVGFTSAYSAVRFNVPASQADSLIAADGSSKTAESFLQVDPADGYTVANGTIRVLNNQALVLGANQNIEVTIADNALQFNSNIVNQNFDLKSFNSSGLLTSLFVNAANEWVGIYTNNPTATLDVNGDTRIRGTLTVEGSMTTINTTNVEIEDLLIELGKVSSPTDSTADGGGISLAGATDKTLTWGQTTDSWNSSENMNLVSGKVYKINNFEVLSQTTLGNTVTNAPGLTSIGTLAQLQVDNININSNVISYVNIGLANGDVVITPKGTGSVDVSAAKITNLQYYVDAVGAPDSSNNYVSTDVAPVGYVDYKFRNVPQGFTVTIGALTVTQLSATILTKIFRPADFEENTYLRVYCPDALDDPLNGHSSLFFEYQLIGPVWVFQQYI